jgi:threonine synthase
VTLEPHGAVAWAGLETYLGQAGARAATAISLETAHPAKFPEEVRDLTGVEPPVPPSLAGLDDMRESFREIPTDYAAFKAHLIQEYRA